MDHVAIMKKSWGLIPKIVSGQKTIESRWYQTKRVPWNKIKVGDRVFFKNSGEPVIAQAVVSDILQFEIKDIVDVSKIIKKYGAKICLVDKNPETWGKLPKYCILIFLAKPEKVEPFKINKLGFGISTAWIIIDNINKIKK